MKPIVCLAALALVALGPGAARAGTVIFVEDFSDESGDPAFDPMFNHSCVVDDPEGNRWVIRESDLRLWLGVGFVNTVTFNLQPDWAVIGASVECWSYMSTARFIGTTGTTEFVADTWPFEGPLLWEVRADQIGPISAIELSASQGAFDNVTIEVVVPEPSGVVLLATGLLVALATLARRRRVV